MKAIVFDIRLGSLYSIRIPFTWQSALTYPILPPSAVIGMVANAMQRYKNDKPPVEYLKQVEDNVVWAGSILRAPCVIKSYTTSAITKWEDKLGGKFTNALGRQFAYSKNLQVLVVFKNGLLVDEAQIALGSTPLTCGDSESPISVESEIKVVNANFTDIEKSIKTDFPIPFSEQINILDGTGRLFLAHERCMKRGREFPLKSYLFPVKENKGILEPSSFLLTIEGNGFRVIDIEKVGQVVLEEKQEEPAKTAKRKPRKKK